MNWIDTLGITFLLMAWLGSLPVLTSFGQFLLVGVHAFRHHLDSCADYTPRVAIVVPAWNEAAVIGATIDRLLALDYPEDAIRVYVVDDASTDTTPDVVLGRAGHYPGRVVHLRRAKGGQGKAHTLNHGLRHLLAEGWAEAVLIIDADVLFETRTLRRMARHLADPKIGAVTAYIKEGSQPGNLVTRFIAFEYITAQAASRRAQNVLGALACLAGGAQLHSMDNLRRIGGEIDTSSLAEDTFTTFRTQLTGSSVYFDGAATVWAEEPDSLDGLWKQRLRWARGNVQLTRAFSTLWFRGGDGHHLGGATFGVLWFSIVLMPAFMILSSLGLIGLYFANAAWAWASFEYLWLLNVFVYLFVTLLSFCIDPPTARRAWKEGFLFPGLISLMIMVVAFWPPLLHTFRSASIAAMAQWDAAGVGARLLTVATYAWVSLSMLAAWGVLRFERRFRGRAWAIPVRNVLLLLVGFGPVLCAITFHAFVAEWQKAELKWDKTEKSGKVRIG